MEELEFMQECLEVYKDYIQEQDTCLEQIELILHRMEYLAVRSASATGKEAANRKELQCEMEYLKAELNQIIEKMKAEGMMESSQVEI